MVKNRKSIFAGFAGIAIVAIVALFWRRKEKFFEDPEDSQYFS